MPEIVVCGRKVTMPSPIYVIPETLQVDDETSTVRGKCLFPTTDASVRDRGDHANITHMMHVVWNSAHIIAPRKGFGQLMAIKTHEWAKKITPPDTEIDFEAKLVNVRRHKGVVMGSAYATFSLNGKTLMVMEVERFIERK